MHRHYLTIVWNAFFRNWHKVWNLQYETDQSILFSLWKKKKKISVSPKHLLHMLFTKELLQSLNVSKFLFPRLSWCLNIIDMRKSIGNNFTIFVIAIIQKLLLNFSLIKGKNRIILLLWGDSRILACFFFKYSSRNSYFPWFLAANQGNPNNVETYFLLEISL